MVRHNEDDERSESGSESDASDNSDVEESGEEEVADEESDVAVEMSEVVTLSAKTGKEVIKKLLIKVGVDDQEAEAIVACSGVATCSDLADLKEEHFAQIARTANAVSRYREMDVVIGVVSTRKVQALAWWFRDAIRRGNKSVDSSAWTDARCQLSIRAMDMEKDTKVSSELTKTLHPGKIQGGKEWVQWSLSFKNYLSTMLGSSGVPLNYVVRDIGDKALKGPEIQMDDLTKLVTEASLKGPSFNQDNRTVFQVLKNCALKTPAWAWIRRLDASENGRLAFAKLSKHYDGPGEVRKRIATAKKQIADIHYKSEQSFSFESYITKLKGAFEVLEECDRPITEAEKVEIMVKGIQCQNQDIHTVKMRCFSSSKLSNNFDKSANKISETVAMVYGGAVMKNQKHIVSGVRPNTPRNGVKFEGGSIPSKVNGVDLSNPFRKFTDEEWKKIPFAVRDKIRAKREKKNTGKRNVSAVTSGTSEQDDSPKSEKSEKGENVSFGSKAYSPKKSKVTFKTSKVVTSQRRICRNKVVYKAHQAPDEPVVGKIELDTHADTSCLGANFVPIMYTSQVCDVYPYSDSYQPKENVPVVTGVTAYDDEETGFTYLLEFNQCLWMGDELDHSLINPNQVRAHGISLCDDAYDEFRPLGFKVPDSGEILPFKLEGNTVVMKTRTPTVDELESIDRYIVMTSEEQWDPKGEPTVRVVRCQTTHEDNQPTYDEHLLGALSLTRHSAVSPEELSKKWKVGLKTAKDTLQRTTQMGVRSAVHPLRRRYRTDLLTLRYPRLKSTFYTDTIVSKYQSIGGCRYAQVYTNGKMVRVFPLTKKMDIAATLQQFIEDVGVPAELVYDPASEMAGRDSSFQDTARYFKVKCRQTETDTPRQNKAESAIRELKAKWRQRVVQEGIPIRLWDYALVYESELMSRTSVSGECTGIEEVTGNTPDISEWLDFTLYDWVWVYNTRDNSMEENPVLARWLGVAHRVGSEMCYWVLLQNGRVVARTTVQHVTKDDADKPAIRDRMTSFDASIKEKLEEGTAAQPIKGQPGVYYLNDEDDIYAPKAEPSVPTPDSFDSNLGATVRLILGGELQRGVVSKRIKDDNGVPVGVAADNPLEDTRMYEVAFENGVSEAVSANLVAQGIETQNTVDGLELFEQISGHQRVVTASGNHTWEFYVHWHGGDATWVPLRSLQVSHPTELAEYLVMCNLEDDPALAHWVKEIRKIQAQVLANVRRRVAATRKKAKKKKKFVPGEREKFGVIIPRTVEEALRLDAENGNHLWQQAIEKEMTNVRIAFEEFTGGTLDDVKARKKLVGYQRINCHMIFDVKMDLTRKARFVAGGHMTEPPESITYSSVVTRESVRIAFLMASVLGLDVCAADVTNAYLNAKCREKIYCVAGPEFGSDKGKIMVISRALYGLKSSGAAWRALLASTLQDMGFKSSLADPDVWLRRAKKPDGLDYYEMVLVYVDDILVISHDTKSIMSKLAEVYNLKAGSVGPPTRYLGATIGKHQLPDGRDVWCMSADEYLENAIKMVDDRMKSDKEPSFNKRQRKRPYDYKYKPELDTSPLLEGEDVTWYQQLIGMLRWVCELGRIDVLYEVGKMSSFNAMPRKGHLREVYNIFYYLHKTKTRKLVFDDNRNDVDVSCFFDGDWSAFYPDADPKVPPNCLPALGTPIKITCFVDANHGGDMVTRRSHTGVIIFLNNTPVVWYSKRQTTVEVSTFGSEFVAMRIAVEKCEALRYKLQMFGIGIDGKIDILCDNKSVVTNSSIPESVLAKKHTSICYHRVREAVASGVLWIAKIPTEENLADLLTKVLSNEVRGYLIDSLHYD